MTTPTGWVRLKHDVADRGQSRLEVMVGDEPVAELRVVSYRIRYRSTDAVPVAEFGVVHFDVDVKGPR